MKRMHFTHLTSLLSLAAILSLAPLFAEDPAEPKQKNRGDRPMTRVKGADDAPIPGCLENLKLTDEQQTKIRDIVATYEAECESVWTKFKHCYRDTVRTEVLLISAIEDNLTAEQQKQVRSERRKLAREARMEARGKPSAKTVSDSKAATEPKGDEAQGGDPAADVQAKTLGNIDLTPEQEEIAEELHDKYYGRMRTLGRQIDSLHKRLVALEADELAEIEAVLTSEQLQQLREIRKEAPTPSKVVEVDAPKTSK